LCRLPATEYDEEDDELSSDDNDDDGERRPAARKMIESLKRYTSKSSIVSTVDKVKGGMTVSEKKEDVNKA